MTAATTPALEFCPHCGETAPTTAAGACEECGVGRDVLSIRCDECGGDRDLPETTPCGRWETGRRVWCQECGGSGERPQYDDPRAKTAISS